MSSLFLYIYWYVETSTNIKAIALKFNLNLEQFLESETWVVVLVLSMLVGLILIGLLVIFVYHQKTYHLYRLQNNFINSFTHELKTPVTSLKLYLETFLKHDLPNEDRVKYINFMLSDANRLSDNITSILNLAKIENKSLGGDFIATDLVTKIDNFYNKNKHLFRNFACNIHPPEFVVIYEIDRAHFEMLLMNLFTNAMKYNNAEKPCIDISFEKHKKKVYIHFTDNGIGLNKSDLKKIFKKFYQVGTVDDMSAKGNGIGLYLSQNIAKIHKGKLQAQSEGQGKGTTVTLSLPFNANQ